jgi:pimeloyl-ACP methyl ester carboxylesterase
VLGAAHPRRMRAALAAGPRAQRSASTHLVAFQTPRYEHRVTRDDAEYVGDLMRRWSGQQWPETDDFAEYARLCRTAIQIPQASFCAMEYSRWAMRSLTRPSGWRYLSLMAEPVQAPTLQLHGSRDSCVLPSTALGSGKYVAGRYEWRLLHGVGHFPQHEAADVVAGELARWAKETTAAPHPK